MEAHNSKTRLGTSEVPLVVKFADAKRKDPTPHHVRPPFTLAGAQSSIDFPCSGFCSWVPYRACEEGRPEQGTFV